MTVAARIGVMNAGRLEQVATPRELYEAPATRWVARFVGDINLFDGQIIRQSAPVTMARQLLIATHEAGTVYVAEPRDAINKDDVCVAIRPEKIKLSRRGPVSQNTPALNRMEGIVTDIGYLGGVTTYKVRLDSGAVLRSSMANTARIDLDAYSVDQRVVAWFTPDDCVVLEQ